jgi:hypothetical protein
MFHSFSLYLVQELERIDVRWFDSVWFDDQWFGSSCKGNILLRYEFVLVLRNERIE